MKNDTYLSILIPVYKSATFVEKTIAETMKVLDAQNYNYEIVLVNDGSPDNSWEVIRDLAERHKEVIAVNLLKNYGQHSAVLCAIQKASGQYMITMDDDLQNPPSEIPKMVKKIEEGYDLVFARFEKKKHASYRKLGTRLVNYLNAKIFEKPDDVILTNFRIFDDRVAQRVLEYNTNYPYIPGLLLLNANRITNVLTKHHAREQGNSNYSFIKIIKLLSRLLINYSSYPLRLLTSIGLVISLISFATGVVIFLNAFYRDYAIPGWASIMIMLSFLNGISILMTGVMGIYISRTLNQLSSIRPYIISDYVTE